MYWEVQIKRLKLNPLQNQAISQAIISEKDNQPQQKIQTNNKRKNLKLLTHLMDQLEAQVELPTELITLHQEQDLLEQVVQHIMIFMQS